MSKSRQKQVQWYEICFKGHIDRHRVYAFDDLTVTYQSGGVTTITGPIPDQATLYGILNRLRDLGIPLISVNRVDNSDK